MKKNHLFGMICAGAVTLSSLYAGENLLKNPTFNEDLKHWSLAGKIVDNTVSKDPGGKSITWKYPKNGKGQGLSSIMALGPINTGDSFLLQMPILPFKALSPRLALRAACTLR